MKPRSRRRYILRGITYVLSAIVAVLSIMQLAGVFYYAFFFFVPLAMIQLAIAAYLEWSIFPPISIVFLIIFLVCVVFIVIMRDEFLFCLRTSIRFLTMDY